MCERQCRAAGQQNTQSNNRRIEAAYVRERECERKREREIRIEQETEKKRNTRRAKTRLAGRQ